MDLLCFDNRIGRLTGESYGRRLRLRELAFQNLSSKNERTLYSSYGEVNSKNPCGSVIGISVPDYRC